MVIGVIVLAGKKGTENKKCPRVQDQECLWCSWCWDVLFHLWGSTEARWDGQGECRKLRGMRQSARSPIMEVTKYLFKAYLLPCIYHSTPGWSAAESVGLVEKAGPPSSKLGRVLAWRQTLLLAWMMPWPESIACHRRCSRKFKELITASYQATRITNTKGEKTMKMWRHVKGTSPAHVQSYRLFSAYQCEGCIKDSNGNSWQNKQLPDETQRDLASTVIFSYSTAAPGINLRSEFYAN